MTSSHSGLLFLVTLYAIWWQSTLSVYNMQWRNITRAKCIVCPINPTVNPAVGRVTALPAHYVPAPLRQLGDRGLGEKKWDD